MNSFATHILVFDSGVGGLSIVEHLRLALPGVAITYLADTLFFPYGMMQEQALVKRVVTLLGQAHERYNPDLIVVACNTASTLVLPTLRETLTIPIVGVVPAIKPAAQLSTSKVIGLLATPGTIRRDYTDELIADFAPECEVIRVGSSQLVQVAEEALRGCHHDPDVFRTALAPFFEHRRSGELDTIVLACTHFPLVKEQLAMAAPGISHWVDSGAAIARRVRQLLPTLAGTGRRQSGDQVLLTGDYSDESAPGEKFVRFGFQSVSQFT